jgi:hypothetical protein
MAGQAASSSRIAIRSRILTAPIGTTAPVDVASAWAAGWNDHGYTDPSGILISPKLSLYDLKTSQTDSPIRTRVTERVTEIQAKLVQVGGLNTMLFFGGGSWAQIPTRAVVDGVLNGTTTVTSATANFQPADVGATIAGVGIPLGATIVTRGSATSVTISVAATITATGVGLTIGAVGTYQYTPPTPGVDDNRMLGIEYTDNAVTTRIVNPIAIVIALGSVPIKSTGELQYDVTFRCNGDAWSILSNDPTNNPALLVA